MKNAEIVKQKKEAGYKNLITHLRSHHDGFEFDAEECMKKNCQPISTMLVHKDAADTYGWVKLIALKNFPFSHVEDPHHSLICSLQVDGTDDCVEENDGTSSGLIPQNCQRAL